MEFLNSLPFSEITGTAVLCAVAGLVITDKLIWHTRLRHCEEQRDKWERIALTALGTAEKLTVQAEVTNEVLTRLPDPTDRGG